MTTALVQPDKKTEGKRGRLKASLYRRKPRAKGPMSKFRIELSGKRYPPYRPSAMSLFAPSADEAVEKVRSMLAQWGVPASDVKMKVIELKEYDK